MHSLYPTSPAPDASYRLAVSPSSAWAKKDNRISPSARHSLRFPEGGSRRPPLKSAAGAVQIGHGDRRWESTVQYHTKVFVQYRTCITTRTVRANPNSQVAPALARSNMAHLPKPQFTCCTHILPYPASDLPARGETEGFPCSSRTTLPAYAGHRARPRQHGSTAALHISGPSTGRPLIATSQPQFPPAKHPIPAASAVGSKRIPARRHLCAPGA